MKKIISEILLLLVSFFVFNFECLASSDEEKAFIESYKKAFEAGDKETLESFLYEQNADPEALEFYKMMMTGDMGNKISEIQLIDLSPEEIKKAASKMVDLNGKISKLLITPSKKLRLKISLSDSNGTSSSSSEVFVSKVGGKLRILVPSVLK